MEQGKYLFHHIKELILHHKTLSILIGCIIVLDVSLIGVISDTQQKDVQKTSGPSQVLTTPPSSR